MLVTFFNGLLYPQSVDTVLTLSRQQVVTANQTKVYADSCKVQKERITNSLNKAVDLIVIKDGQIDAQAKELRLCNKEAYLAKENEAAAKKDAKKQKGLRKVNGIIMWVEGGIIIAMTAIIILSK